MLLHCIVLNDENLKWQLECEIVESEDVCFLQIIPIYIEDYFLYFLFLVKFHSTDSFLGVCFVYLSIKVTITYRKIIYRVECTAGVKTTDNKYLWCNCRAMFKQKEKNKQVIKIGKL